MIHVIKEMAIGNGSVPVYMDDLPRRGDVVPVESGGKEGTAIVYDATTLMFGSRYLVYLDVDWSSFERFPDGE